MKKYILLIMLFLPIFMMAQNCDEAFQEGVKLLNQNTKESITKALRKFESAKKCYKVNRDNRGVDNCNEKIDECTEVLSFQESSRGSGALAISPKDLKFPLNQGELEVTVNTNGSWSFSGCHDWCYGEKRGTKLVIKVDENQTPVRRSQTVTIKSGKYRQSVIVTQEGAEDYALSLSDETLFFSCNIEEKNVEINANHSWDAKNLPGWCHVKIVGSRLFITTDPNPTPELRTDICTIISGKKTAELRLIQDGNDFYSSNSSLIFSSKKDEKKVEITYKGGYSWTVKSFPTWCSVSKLSDNILSVQCMANKNKSARYGDIILSAGEKELIIKLGQSGKKSIIGTLFAVSSEPLAMEECNFIQKDLSSLFGIKIGKTTTTQVAEMGHKKNLINVGPSSYFIINSVTFGDYDGDNMIDVCSLIKGNPMPDEWKIIKDFSWESSFIVWTKVLKTEGYEVVEVEKPENELQEGRKVLKAKIVATNESNGVKIELAFDHGNMNGEGYTTLAKNSLYSITVNCSKK